MRQRIASTALSTLGSCAQFHYATFAVPDTAGCDLKLESWLAGVFQRRSNGHERCYQGLKWVGSSDGHQLL